MKNAVLLFCLTAAVYSAEAKKPRPADSVDLLRKEREVILENRSLNILDMITVRSEDWTELPSVPEHPAFDGLFSSDEKEEILRQVNRRRKLHGSDTLLTADYFHIWRPWFDRLEEEDPHYRVFPVPLASAEHYKKARKVYKDPGNRRLPFDCILIHDTLIISRSFDPLYRVGDRVVSINGVTVPEYLGYNYSDRFVWPAVLMIYYYYSFAVDNFNVVLERSGRSLEIDTPGVHEKELVSHTMKEYYNVTAYEDAGAGYIQVRRFYPNNNRLIKIVRNAILDFKRQGITDVIIDVRRNGGGNGHNFDKLVSIFTDKPKIEYLRGQKIKVSDKTLRYYDFLTEDMVGEVVDMPEGEFVASFSTDPKMFVEGMNYYILVSKDTGSVAASLVNILQYNGAAKVAGEPLRRNALKYGEVVQGSDINSTLLYPTGISTVEFDEYTRAVDGVLIPDIVIPYLAGEYLTGRDAVLERFLEIIKTTK
ncbi:MAG: S41 family peptidase [Alistipes sp.]|nr:S41 family peptidase [Alistipes sp.]